MATLEPSFRRFGVIAAGTVGFLVGAAGLVAARDASVTSDETNTSAVVTATVPDAAPTTTADTSPDSTGPDSTGDATPDDGPTTTMADSPTTVPDDSSTTTLVDDTGPTGTLPDGGPTTTVADGPMPTSTLPDDDDGPGTTLPDDDDGPDTTLPDDDDDGPSTTVAGVPSTTVVSLPAPFSETYVSAGGSIHVSWTGTAFVLHSIDPAPGFSPEIEDQRWDKVRVDFDADGDDSRIEVRLDDTGHIRVRID